MITVQLKMLLCCRDLPQEAATPAPTVVRAHRGGLHTFVTTRTSTTCLTILLYTPSLENYVYLSLKLVVLVNGVCVTAWEWSLCRSLITAVKACAQHASMPAMHVPPNTAFTPPHMLAPQDPQSTAHPLCCSSAQTKCCQGSLWRSVELRD